jgi:hypothetical protein
VAGNSFVRTPGLKKILYAGEGLEAIGAESFNNELMEAFVENYGRVEGSLPEASLREAVLSKESIGSGGLFSCRGWREESRVQFEDDLNYYQAVGLISISGDERRVDVSPVVEKAFEAVDQNTDKSKKIF